MDKLFYWLIILIAGLAIYGSFGLVMNEWNQGSICPKIFGIPACYIVITCFFVGLIGHLVNNPKGTWVFFVSIGIVTIIAITGTIGELTGTTKCPRTTQGIPMCFISLVICFALLISKIAMPKFILPQNGRN